MDAAPSAPAGALTPLYHRRHAKQQRARALAHLGPATVLLLGVAPLLSGAERLTPLAALEIAVGAAYLVLLVRELRHLRHDAFHHERVAWLELAAAGILAVEGYHSWHRHHAANLARGTYVFHALPYVFWAVAGVYAGLAFGAQGLGRRRYLHLHADGFGLRTRLLGPAQEVRWADLAAVETAGPAGLLVRRTTGQTHRISFANIHEGAAQRDRLVAHVRKYFARSAAGDGVG